MRATLVHAKIAGHGVMISVSFNLQMEEVQEKTSSYYKQRIQEVKQETAEQVKSYYLKCLHSSCDQSQAADMSSLHCSSKSHDSEAKYHSRATLKTDSESVMQSNTKGSKCDQESLKKTSRRLATFSRSRGLYASTKPSKVPLSSSTGSQVSIGGTSSSNVHRGKSEATGAERRPRRKIDEKVLQHKTSSRSDRAPSKFVPATKQILHRTGPGTCPPVGVYWKN